MAETKPIPEGMPSVIPHLVCNGAADAITFYGKAGGAKELNRIAGPDGKLMNAMIQVGDSRLMVVDEYPEWHSYGPKTLKGAAVTFHMYVEDVDAAFKRAVDAGATVKMPPADMFWGDRYGVVEDPFGHLWSVATHIRDMNDKEIEEAMIACGPM